ncbi:signal peptidase I [Halothermothrix orenii]|uniref:Signal peptidase I n=1 Tax=Halothermothrix orenii (strain H 168 / OCM 544 / DSM 9562) TaxID=373903 RepID=B8CXF8_HALOH|nr:signal peptidase I [Halothermothrix orenii]ACL69977.1 signal peptidase I [Halothermothrix orenii H 168]
MDSTDIKEFFQSFVIAAILAFFIITFIAQSFVVDGESMEPTLHDGERLFVNKFIYRFHPPERYDIVVFRPYQGQSKRFIKRVIGLPGETIFIRDGVTYINGEPLKEDFINGPMRRKFGPFYVPENSVFVMGDNRNNSMDSRHFGCVPFESIEGRAFWVYWPVTKMRLIGHKVE